MKKREKAARALRKVCAVALVPAAVLAVAFVWRAALGNDPGTGTGERTRIGTDGTQEQEDEGVIYRLGEDAYLFLRDRDGNHADAAYVYPPGGEVYGEDGKVMEEKDLETGDRVKVLSNGCVMETYPCVYGEVYRIEVIKKADGAARQACIEKYQEELEAFYMEP